MKLNSFIDPVHGDDPNDLSAGLLGRAHWVTRSNPPGAKSRKRTLPEPPPLGDDRVSVSLEATYLMVGDRYDPHYLSPNGLVEMMDLMRAGGAVSHGEKAILLKGPTGRGYPMAEAMVPRNIISDWQNALARAVGRSDLGAVSRATQALGILGRVAVTRLPQ